VAEHVLHGLSLDGPVEEHLAGRVRAFDAAWRLMAERLEEAGQDAKLSFEVQPNGRLKLNVDRLGTRGDAPEDRPAGPAVRGRFLDRVPGRLRTPGRRPHPHG
jgi:hypothetical protein